MKSDECYMTRRCVNNCIATWEITAETSKGDFVVFRCKSRADAIVISGALLQESLSLHEVNDCT